MKFPNTTTSVLQSFPNVKDIRTTTAAKVSETFLCTYYERSVLNLKTERAKAYNVSLISCPDKPPALLILKFLLHKHTTLFKNDGWMASATKEERRWLIDNTID